MRNYGTRPPLLLALLLISAMLTGCGAALPTALVRVGELQFQVEVAQTEETQRTGLARRETVAPGTGMLFQFAQRQERQVWMADMKVALDIAWIVDERVLAVLSLEPCRAADQTQCQRWTSPAPVDAFLEVPAGALAGIKPKTPVSIRLSG